MIDDLDLEEFKAELEGINTYGERYEDYLKLSEYHLPKALEALSELLDAIRKEENGPIPVGAVQFRYDGGSKKRENVMDPKHAKTTSLILEWKSNKKMRRKRVGIKALPYHEFENNDPGLRISGYATVDWNFLKE
jgi:hypothetical protein